MVQYQIGISQRALQQTKTEGKEPEFNSEERVVLSSKKRITLNDFLR